MIAKSRYKGKSREQVLQYQILFSKLSPISQLQITEQFPERGAVPKYLKALYVFQFCSLTWPPLESMELYNI